MEHPLPLLRYLPAKYKSKTGGRPSGKEVLQAALQVEQIDDYVKDRIRVVLDLWPKIEEAQANLPESVKGAVEDLRQQLANKTVEEQRSVLRDRARRSRASRRRAGRWHGGCCPDLEDGRDSIYSPNHSFYNMIQEGGSSRAAARDALSDIGSADTIGGAVGGAAGSVAGGRRRRPRRRGRGRCGIGRCRGLSILARWLSSLFD